MLATGCFSFDITAIPAGATLVDATLTIHVTSSVGDPFAQHGPMQVHYLPYGDDLANAPTTIIVNPPDWSTVSPSTVTSGPKMAGVKPILDRAIADGMTRCQVQVGWFGTFLPVDGNDDYVVLSDGENSVVGPPGPSLEFRWTQP